MGNWLAAHARNCITALGKLSRTPIGTLLTITVIGIALALPAALLLMVRNGEAVAGGWDSVRDFSIYLVPGSDAALAEAMRDDLGARDGIESVQWITAEDALAGFRSEPGYGDLLDTLDGNPLPDTLVVRPSDSLTPEALSVLRAEIENREGVDQVRLDTAWIERLNAILDLARRGIWLVGGLLLIAVVVIVGNTIRLDIQNQRAEIEVSKLLGATDAFVRRPFLYLGFWYGFAGGLLALVILLAAVLTLSGPVQRLVALYGSNFQPLGADGATVLAVVASGLIAGLAGAWTAVARHLAAIQPKV
jgi:cell division transport system permease protein